MNQIFTRLIKLTFILLFPALSFAQQGSKDYNLLLNSGKFIPVENISTLTKTTDVFQKSLYGDKYYVTLQFKELPGQELKDQLKSQGIELIDYIPSYAYTAIVPANIEVAFLRSLPLRSVLQFSTEQKMPGDLFKNEIPTHAVKATGYIDLTVTTYEKISVDKIASSLNALGTIILADNQVFRSFTMRVPIANIKRIAELAFVQWVEAIAPPNVIENLPGRTLHRVNILNDGVRNLKGDGINVGVWDGGAVSTQHLDFSPAGRLTIMQTALGTTDHGTHVAGTIAGKGLVNPIARGMAPNAKLFSWDFNGDIQTEMATGIPANNLLVSNHSYGFSFSGSCNFNNGLLVYESISRATDINLNNFPSHLHVHSAGNSGGACSGGFFTITGSGKQAKNNLVVADISTTEAIAGSSSRGPLQDGRIKPEISAMGSSVFSTWIPDNAYTTISGTSMATPGVTGSAALLYQRYKQLNGDANPPSALIKNIICNAAEDLGNPGPDYTFGFGRLNALTSVKILEQNRYVMSTVATGANNDVTITVPAGAVKLRAMLTWNDPAGALNANPALVNNLDLSVINGATTTLPWILDKNTPGANATRGVDTYGNIEQVTIDNPTAGTYTLKVTGTAVPVGPNQSYSLTWIIDQQYIEVLYPNGGESLVPGTTQTITWDKAGISGTQTVEFSLNNGGTWTTISSSVGANTTRLNWAIPAGTNTATALIRVSSGAVTDLSDANFTIIGATNPPVAAATCNGGEINYTWTAVANATHYDLYRLDQATGNFVILVSDLTVTSYTATGLTPGTVMLVALVAKNNITGAVSGRSNAVSFIVPSNGGGLSPIGSVSGQNVICGALSNIVYSVPAVTGATSYTWTAPPNTTIVSGQGTNTITVNYFAASTSGNVSVFASAGACQTSVASLPITVSGVAVAAPSSGGDQTVTVCPPNPTPTLTATATVPAGHSIVWYDAPANGNAVANPTLSATGTITYYAASMNTSTGCQSGVRTPVVLTINAAVPAVITAGGPTTFCQGGNVVLTASAGSSYLWSNGSTSPTIAVTSSGAYSVVVTTGGCNLTSAVTNVTVNPLPAANISASGPVTFCEGSNVVLTASAGNAWLWSNGATTQAITVNTSGAFTVRVTNAAGCFANSSVTTTTANTRPTVTLSAAPFTKLFPGLSTTLTATVNPAGTYTYTWLKNGAAVTGATTPTLAVTLDKLGDYSVMVTNNSTPPCSNTSAVVAISDSATNKLFVYPNPTTGQFQVNFYTTTTGQHRLSVYDAKGAIAFSKPYAIAAPYQRLDVDIRQHGSGVYVVVLYDKSGKKLASRQVVIQ